MRYIVSPDRLEVLIDTLSNLKSPKIFESTNLGHTSKVIEHVNNINNADFYMRREDRFHVFIFAVWKDLYEILDYSLRPLLHIYFDEV